MALKILLADDDMTAQNTGKKILAAAGYDVVTVSNGVAAIKKIAEVHPDIVLLDVYMAGYSGVELCRKVKATAALAKMPILLTVGKMEPFSAEQGIKADGLIVKPFNVSNLITAVEKLAGRSRLPEPAASPCVNVHEFQVSKELAADTQARPKQKPPESPVSEVAVHSQPTPEPSEAYQSAPATGGKRAQPSFSRQQGGEVCDVCGHVNQKGASACQQCDVPLPSSVMAPSGDREAHRSSSAKAKATRIAHAASKDIGQMAGAIWHALNARGERSLAQLKKQVNAKGPLFDWAIGWLAREDKIIITPKKGSFTIRLK
jgi:CheY-like chemotaxis protein